MSVRRKLNTRQWDFHVLAARLKRRDVEFKSLGSFRLHESGHNSIPSRTRRCIYSKFNAKPGQKVPAVREEKSLDEFRAAWTRKGTIANWTAPREPFCLSSLSPRCLSIYLFSLFTRIYRIRQLTSRTLLCSGRYSYGVYSVRHRSPCL